MKGGNVWRSPEATIPFWTFPNGEIESSEKGNRSGKVKNEKVWGRWSVRGPILFSLKGRLKPKAQAKPKAPPDHQKSIRFFTIIHMADSPCPNPYKTCRLRSLLEPFLQNGTKKYQKGLGFPLKVDDNLGLCKISKSIGPRAFWSTQQSWWNTLLNLSFMEPFGTIFA